MRTVAILKLELAPIVAITRPGIIVTDVSIPFTGTHELEWIYLAELVHAQVSMDRLEIKLSTTMKITQFLLL